MKTKSCSNQQCQNKNPQPISNFGINKSSKDGYRWQCKDCHKKYYEENRKKIIESAINRRKVNWKSNRQAVWKRKGVRNADGSFFKWHDYEVMLAQQSGLCKTCGVEDSSGNSSNLKVDHDHATGTVRGILCNKCNIALGQVKDKIETLEKMILYLKRSRGLKFE